MAKVNFYATAIQRDSITMVCITYDFKIQYKIATYVWDLIVHSVVYIFMYDFCY